VKVGKLSKGSTVSVITPTAVAGVRGTEFWGQVTKKKEEGVFAVRDGSVEIQLNGSTESLVVNKGEAVEISPVNKTLKSRKAKDAELNAMSQIDEIKIVESK
jgi:ferric-dicitrate binding protein FerR (iron transport regulator)